MRMLPPFLLKARGGSNHSTWDLAREKNLLDRLGSRRLAEDDAARISPARGDPARAVRALPPTDGYTNVHGILMLDLFFALLITGDMSRPYPPGLRFAASGK